MDEHETAIHWSCLIQEVTKAIDSQAYSTPVEYGAAVVDAASEIWAWHERVFSGALATTVAVSVPASIRGDPGPDVPYDDSEALAPGGFVSRGPAAPRCGTGPEDAQGCGTEMVYWSGTNKEGVDYAGWKCPNQKKSRDPAEQAAEKVRHPVQWIN